MYKQVIIVRKDIKLGVGKAASQAAHAAVGSMKLADLEDVARWEKEGSKKVVLKVKSVEELKSIQEKLKKNRIPHFLVKDAGLTQLKKGIVTALGIGPIEEKKIDRITGKLKLL